MLKPFLLGTTLLLIMAFAMACGSAAEPDEASEQTTAAPTAVQESAKTIEKPSRRLLRSWPVAQVPYT